jgi:hypothetical protein
MHLCAHLQPTPRAGLNGDSLMPNLRVLLLRSPSRQRYVARGAGGGRSLPPAARGRRVARMYCRVSGRYP